MAKQFTPYYAKVLISAEEICTNQGEKQVKVRHLLHGILCDSNPDMIGFQILTTHGINAMLINSIISVQKKHQKKVSQLSTESKNVIQTSVFEAEKNKWDYVTTGHLLVSISLSNDPVIKKILQDKDLITSKLRAEVNQYRNMSNTGEMEWINSR